MADLNVLGNAVPTNIWLMKKCSKEVLIFR